MGEKLFVMLKSLPSYIYYIKYKSKLKLANKRNKSDLLDGIEKHPNDKILCKELAKCEMDNQNWSSSVHCWKKVFRLNKKNKKQDYIEYSKALHANGDTSKAITVLKKGEKYYPNYTPIISKLIELYIYETNSKNVIKYYDILEKKVNKNCHHFSFDTYVNIFKVYKDAGFVKRGKNILDKADKLFPEQKNELMLYYGDLEIVKKNWGEAIRLYEQSIPNNTFNKQITLAMLYKINGDQVKFEKIFKHVIEDNEKDIKEDALGYRKIILFDNGESRIEFYKKLGNTNSIILTFDSIKMTWEEAPFGFKLLQKENVDIISLRKRRKKSYSQDIDQDAFNYIVAPILTGYNNRMAYGYSLGGYQALYFASVLDCRILALAPRLSIHPHSGNKKIVEKYKMRHKLNLDKNTKIQPVIAYDPKNKQDRKYVIDKVLPSFPNAEVISIPYGGHGLAPHLLKSGQLKSFVYDFLENRQPVYNHQLKVRSPHYFKNLGEACLKRNKYKWSLDLADKALELNPRYQRGIKLKIKALKKLGYVEELHDFMVEMDGSMPEKLSLRLYLVDIFIELKYFTQAKSKLFEIKKRFGDRRPIINRLNELEKVYYKDQVI